MKVILLAAGYATRLYPLTRDRAKPLLDVGGRPIASRIVDRLMGLDGVRDVTVITNARFADSFRRWRDTFECPVPIKVLDDGTLSEHDRLGAVGDLAFALRARPPEDEAVLVAAGDNLVEFDIETVARDFAANPAPRLTVRRVERNGPSRYNEVCFGPDDDARGEGRVVRFREKPADPTSSWAAIALYFFPPQVADWVETYLANGGNPDAPGHFIAWLVENTPTYASRLDGEWLDIGTPETLAAARARFAGPSDAD